MSVRAEDVMARVLAGLPVVDVPLESGTHVRRGDHTTVLRDGTPMPLQTDAPANDVALAICGWWPWSRLVRHLRTPVLTGCPDGITVDRIDDQRRYLVTGPGGQMIVVLA